MKADDDERRQWSLSVYGIDTSDPSLYDIVFHVQTLEVDDVVRMILEAVNLPAFTTTPDSQAVLDDLTLAAQVEVTLVEEFSKVKVTAKNGEARIIVITGLTFVAALAEEEKIIRRVESITTSIGGAQRVRVTLSPSI
ncbi:MAG TPA: hypothetical protein VEI04_04885 [Syntrophobacteria bacterium]|nr:hypothetical protein [Syntrophobacteria bacterium]